MAMSEPKPFASLSSGLLARKGAAKPAMRPQSFSTFGGIEDLGWNDMGQSVLPQADFHEEPREHVPSSISALTPAPKSHEPVLQLLDEDELHDLEPPVVEQQRAIEAHFATDQPVVEPAPAANETIVPALEPADVVALPRRTRQAAGSKRKAAFTLRLDPDRHLKLRLACAVKHRSAQQIVTEALEQYLQSLPELDALAQQLPAQAGKRN
jgi:hypothetical protein